MVNLHTYLTANPYQLTEHGTVINNDGWCTIRGDL